MTVETRAAQKRAAMDAGLTPGAAAVLMLIAAAGFVTRLWGLGDKSLWLDEAFTWAMTRLAAGDIISAARDQDIHPPAHYLLLRFWSGAFGDSELALRLPSALAAGGSFLLLAYAGWRVGGLALAALAALLLAVNPAALEYAQEARFYPLIGLLALAATLCQVSYVTSPRPLPLVLYIIASVTMVYTHYSGFVVLAVHALVFGWFGIQEWRGQRTTRLLAGAALAGAAVAAAYAPWYAALFQQIDTGGASAVPDPSPRL
ncbi:MAG TPA: glycosyltransferase family 39 protein, partial [Dehalococcoidia bacterium]|nr:glycosyltransferase family 39 protein [Dehalococcoidia bacterium]